MRTLPSSVTVVGTVGWPGCADTRDRAAVDAFWAGKTAALLEARELAASIASKGELATTTCVDDFHSTMDEGGTVSILAAPADGWEILSYTGDGTARWDRLGKLWVTSSFASDGSAGHWAASAYFSSVEERDAFIARFPKLLGLRPSTLSGSTGVIPSAVAQGNLYPDGVNGGVNEAGIKRLRAIVAKVPADELGYSVVYGNSHPNLQSLLDTLPKEA